MTALIGFAALTGLLCLYNDVSLGWWCIAAAFGLALVRYIFRRLPTP